MMETKEMQTGGAAVTVKMSKLTEGVGIIFSGVLTMLEALDASGGSNAVEQLKAVKNIETAASAGKETEDENEDAADGSQTPNAGISDSADGNAADCAVNEESVTEDPESVEPAKKAKASKKNQEEKHISTLGQDDITKVIVQKIKKDRSNSAKVESILKTYGVARVSELPDEKYEAFMTDIAQL